MSDPMGASERVLDDGTRIETVIEGSTRTITTTKPCGCHAAVTIHTGPGVGMNGISGGRCLRHTPVVTL